MDYTHAAAFRDFLAACSIDPSEHVRAWLRPLEEAEQAPARAKRETQADRVELLLQEIEKRAEEEGVPFDRQAMPGTKADLLVLAHAWDPALRSIRTTESLSEHLTGRCKWPLDASSKPSALPLYARLFGRPDLCAPRGVSARRRAS